MKSEEIIKLIDEKIKAHEVKVGLVSGIFGLSVFIGFFHAIRLNHQILSRLG